MRVIFSILEGFFGDEVRKQSLSKSKRFSIQSFELLQTQYLRNELKKTMQCPQF